MIHGILFDLGSTLLYNAHDYNWGAILPRMRGNLLAHLHAAGYTLDGPTFLNHFSAKFQEFDEQRQTDWVEYTTEWILRRTLEELGAPPPEPPLIAAALQAYYAYSESLWQPMPDLHETLQQLVAAQLKLAIISNASDNANVQRLIDRADLRRYFDPIIVSAAVGIRKPNPKIFERVLNDWQLPPQACVMIGDRLGADILGAQMAHLHTIWLTTQADHPANTAHRDTIIPEATAATLADLPALIEKLQAF
jgi:putative hydrolase of the HAD superfamily